MPFTVANPAPATAPGLTPVGTANGTMVITKVYQENNHHGVVPASGTATCTEIAGGQWNFHQVVAFNDPTDGERVYDGCLRLKQATPRIPIHEQVNGTYKADLFQAGFWTPQARFEYTGVS